MNDLRQREFNPLKILHHVDRLRALAQGRDVAPVTVEIDPVAYCNHACDWCVDPVHTPATMSDSLFENLIDELAAFTVDTFRVEGVVFKGGGEPTLHPRFGRFVELATARNFAVGTVTNGSRLHAWAEVLAACAAYVRVSVDGPTAESHARIHRSDDFHQILAGVERLMTLRNGRRHPVVGLTFAIDGRSIDLADEAIRLGERLRVDYVLLRPPFFEEVGRESTMTVDEARQVRRQLQAAAARHEGVMDVFVGQWVGDAEQQASVERKLAGAGRRDMYVGRDVPIEHRTGRCLASPLLAVVTADGKLYGCCNLRALPAWSFGQLDYAQGIGFRQLWDGRQRKDVLARMHRTECIQRCTHPAARYNEIIEVLRDGERPHSQFV
ncbi:MAG: radical SAM protein [Planctomycetes bacterium]|nr:radical SAM protein [Planctomycetota bacterium]